MSCVAMSVGLGNIWRFPFTAYENGGGAFLIPYIIILTVIGRPLYYMEMTLGQFSNRGNVRFFKSLSPYLKGETRPTTVQFAASRFRRGVRTGGGVGLRRHLLLLLDGHHPLLLGALVHGRPPVGNVPRRVDRGAERHQQEMRRRHGQRRRQYQRHS